MAVANTLTSVRAGVCLVQGTVNGIGERTGNADLCSIIPSLALHCDVEKMSCKGNLGDVTSLSRFVDETLNRTPNPATASTRRSRGTSATSDSRASATWACS